MIPASAPRDVAAALERNVSALYRTGNRWVAMRPIVARDLLHARGVELDRVLAGMPATLESRDVLRAVGHMLRMFTVGQTVPDADAVAIVAGYVTAVQDKPGWAVVVACRDFLSNRVPGRNPAFMPKPPELVARVDALLAPFHEERLKIARVLSADEPPPPPTAAARNRVIEVCDLWREASKA